MSGIIPITPQLDSSGQFLTSGYDAGTPLDYFDLDMALIPGMAAKTVIDQINLALAFWTPLQTSPNSLTAQKAQYAVSVLSAERTRVTNPPTNALHVVYPV